MTERRTGEPLDGRRGSLGVAYRCRLSPVTLGSGWRRSDGWQLTASAMDPVLCIHVAGRALSGHCEEDGSTYETRSPRPTTEGDCGGERERGRLAAPALHAKPRHRTPHLPAHRCCHTPKPSPSGSHQLFQPIKEDSCEEELNPLLPWQKVLEHLSRCGHIQNRVLPRGYQHDLTPYPSIFSCYILLCHMTCYLHTALCRSLS
nr:uncharacterized protein LOC111843399 isoform X1 [Paramormyrops kingsleyae]